MNDYKQGLLSESIIYCTALYLAAQNGHRDVVKLISELPIKPIGSHFFKYTAFYFAAQNGHLNVLEHFARNGINFMDDIIDETTVHLEHSTDNSANRQSSGVTSIQDNLNADPLQVDVILNPFKINDNTNNKTATSNKITETKIENIICNNYNASNQNVEQLASVKINEQTNNEMISSENIETELNNSTENTNNVAKEQKFENIFDAVKIGSVEQVNMFITDYADVNACDENKNTLLHFAAARGDVDIIKILLDKSPNLKQKNKVGNTPIHIACAFGNVGVVEQFLERGVNIRITNPLGNTPILLAAKYNRSEIFKLLLDKGASIEGTNKVGDTCLHLAVKVGCQPVDELHLESKEEGKDDVNAKHLSVVDENSIIATLLKENVDVNIKNQEEETAIFCTADITIFDMLHKKGFDLKLNNKTDETVFHNAARFNYVHLIDHLLKQRLFDVDSVSKNGETAFFIAAEYGHSDVTELLLNYDAKLDVQSTAFIYLLDDEEFCDFNALHVAVFNGHYNVVEILLENGMDVNSCFNMYYKNASMYYENASGDCNLSPLMIAAIKGHVNITELLLTYRANKHLPAYNEISKKTYQYNMEVKLLIENY